MASFEMALELGADAIEMDIQLSADGRLVVFHDTHLKRTTGMTGLVESKSWEEIQRLDAGSWFHRRFGGERVPLLSDVLTRFKARLSHRGRPVQWVIELKAQETLAKGRRLARAAFEEIGRYAPDGNAIVISFEHEYLVEGNFPDVRKGILYSKRLKDPVERARSFGAHLLFPRKDLVSRALVANAREAHLGVFTWTANSGREFKRLLDLDVDGITTNYPDRLLKWLEKEDGL